MIPRGGLLGTLNISAMPQKTLFATAVSFSSATSDPEVTHKKRAVTTMAVTARKPVWTSNQSRGGIAPISD